MTTTEQTYTHWQLKTDSDHILWLYINRADATANSLNAPVLQELSIILDGIKSNQQLRGLVIASGKPSGFIAGADIEQFTKLKDVNEAVNLIREGQLIFQKLADLKIPTLALIEGFCLGGGLELTLACRYRIAENGPKTKLGLPEVMLGIHPGWGGTVRLPHLIGALNAIPLILTGRTVNAKAAEKLGIIDVAVPKRHLVTAARDYILKQPKPHRANTLATLSNHSLLRPLLGKVFSYQTKKKIKPAQYPAPFAVINNWVQHGVQGEAAYVNEAQSIGNLLLTETSRNLVRVYFLQDRLKGLAKGTKFSAEHVHVVGAGTMGGDIAAWCALRGMRVTLQDREPKYIAPAIKRAFALFKGKLKEPRLIQQAMDRLMPDPTGLGVKKADVIIEAIFENLAAKQSLLQKLEQDAKPTAIIATNTSSILLDEMNQALKDPSRLVGIHFFNPVAKMMLVEVVAGSKTSTTAQANAIAFVRKLDKLPLPVKSSPGFLVNRILSPYLLEAVTLLAEGIPPAAIDKAAVDFGMPMGPIELADTVGLDVCLSVGENLAQHFGGGTLPERLKTKVANKELGRKTNKGFYNYKNGKIIKPKIPANYVPPKDLSARLIMRMVNEAAACMREHIVADADLLDAGMIFGTGFAPFRGGPMNYSRKEGIDKFRKQLIAFQQQYGERFKLDEAWNKTETLS